MTKHKVRIECDVFVDADNAREAEEIVIDEIETTALDWDDITVEAEMWSD